MKRSTPLLQKKRPIIGLNGRFLVAQRTGVQRSAYWLFKSIIERNRDFDFVLFTGESERYAPEWQRPFVKIVTSPLTSRASLGNYFWEQFTLPKIAQQYDLDILHNPANLAPLFYKGKSIIHIHDLSFLIEPSWFSLTFRTAYRLLVPRIAKNSSLVITNSNHSKNDLLERLDLSLSKVRLGYWAVDPIFSSLQIPYEKRTHRMLFVGSLEPRKNLSGLLKAFNIFKARNPECDYVLTLVGCENALFADANYDLGAYRKHVEFVGYVSDRDLAALYGNSKMLVYPSFYEGFGFPPLEAMSAGTPVITSWNSSLPEVTGNAALLVNPSDPKHIAMEMETIYKNGSLALELVKLGKKQASLFSWDRVADHVLDIYKDLLETK